MLHSQATREINRVKKCIPVETERPKTTVNQCKQGELQYASTSKPQKVNSPIVFRNSTHRVREGGKYKKYFASSAVCLKSY